jgi:hypothetical protein
MADWKPISECPFGEIVLAACRTPSTSILGPKVIWWTEEEATDWPEGWPAPTHYAEIPDLDQILSPVLTVLADADR